MRKVTSVILIAGLLICVAGSMTGCMRPKKNWYESALAYYSDGIKNGFTTEYSNLDVPVELRNENIKFGYMLYELDGDGTNELLIGMIDEGDYTKFTNVIAYHRGLGPDCLLTGSQGYYVYLCASGVLRYDSWLGSETQKDYMKFNSNDLSFTLIDGEGKYLPMKWELTEF